MFWNVQNFIHNLIFTPVITKLTKHMKCCIKLVLKQVSADRLYMLTFYGYLHLNVLHMFLESEQKQLQTPEKY